MAEVPGGGMPGSDPFELLENSKTVQADLGLTPHQLENLHIASRNFHTELADLMRPQPGISPEEQRARIQQHIANTRGMIARELSSEQLHRLQQIMLQIEGPCLAIMDTEVEHNLGLSSDQQRSLAAACQQRNNDMLRAFRPPAPGEDFCTAMSRNRDRISALRARADEHIISMLDPAQRATLTRMKGVILHLEPPIPPNCLL